MDREEIMKMYKSLSERIASVEKKVDAYYSMQNSNRKTETSDNSDAIFELADMVAELEAKNG